MQLATHANRMAQEFYTVLKDTHTFIYPVQANEAFMKLPETDIIRLQNQGFEFHVWPGSTDIIRLVFSHATILKNVKALIQVIQDENRD